MKTSAVISDCQSYRYSLHRIWDVQKPTVLFIGLNPSTADASLDDPTIRRCIGFARRWGYGGLCMANLFAFRATNPKDMKKAEDPIGPENDAYLARLIEESDLVIACWGVHGTLNSRASHVKEIFIGRLKCLGITKEGHPRHPLYLRSDTDPIDF